MVDRYSTSNKKAKDILNAIIKSGEIKQPDLLNITDGHRVVLQGYVNVLKEEGWIKIDKRGRINFLGLNDDKLVKNFDDFLYQKNILIKEIKNGKFCELLRNERPEDLKKINRKLKKMGRAYLTDKQSEDLVKRRPRRVFDAEKRNKIIRKFFIYYLNKKQYKEKLGFDNLSNNLIRLSYDLAGRNGWPFISGYCIYWPLYKKSNFVFLINLLYIFEDNEKWSELYEV